MSLLQKEFKTCSMRHPDSFKEGHCDLCGSPLPLTKSGVPAKNRRWCSTSCRNKFTKHHVWRWARREARRRDKYKCVKCGSSDRIEVNHIVPLVGKGYKAGCSHHLDNLETNCKSCHQEVTNEQRRLRKEARARDEGNQGE